MADCVCHRWQILSFFAKQELLLVTVSYPLRTAVMGLKRPLLPDRSIQGSVMRSAEHGRFVPVKPCNVLGGPMRPIRQDEYK
ncbi:hypothetical protein N436_00484 [Pseudomonas sp. RV120224-01b]|nr:hypothetical protein N428_00485 [Pseudomonas sp. RV120224-01c]PYG86390.1 hypothetical protein N436_00484 [Pseudomonas sp. RV120224-01b]